jgi:hypothetical protein
MALLLSAPKLRSLTNGSVRLTIFNNVRDIPSLRLGTGKTLLHANVGEASGAFTIKLKSLLSLRGNLSK